MRYSVFCIIEAGELEIQAVLLLCSISKRLQGDYRVFACLPIGHNQEMELQPETKEMLNTLEIPLIRIQNPYLQEIGSPMPGDAFSNKYFALPHVPESDYTLFLDSDMMLVKYLYLEDHFHGADFLAKPVCYMNESRWEALFALFGMNVPLHLVRSTVDNIEGPPYFNGGLFCVRSGLANILQKTWYETFTKINESRIMEDNPVNREQAALAISVARMKISYCTLTEQLNYPARSKQIGSGDHPFMLHYHDPETIYKTQAALKAVNEMILAYPALKELMKKMNNWRILISSPLSIRHAKQRAKARIKGVYQSRSQINCL